MLFHLSLKNVWPLPWLNARLYTISQLLCVCNLITAHNITCRSSNNHNVQLQSCWKGFFIGEHSDEMVLFPTFKIALHFPISVMLSNDAFVAYRLFHQFILSGFVWVHNLRASIYLLLPSEGVGIRQQLCELRAAFVILISKQVEVIYWLSAQQSPMGITRVCSSPTTPEIEVSSLMLLFRLSLISNPLQPQCVVIAAGFRDEMSGSLTCRSVPN